MNSNLNKLKWIYFWWILGIWNHCATAASSRYSRVLYRAAPKVVWVYVASYRCFFARWQPPPKDSETKIIISVARNMSKHNVKNTNKNSVTVKWPTTIWLEQEKVKIKMRVLHDGLETASKELRLKRGWPRNRWKNSFFIVALLFILTSFLEVGKCF